MQRTIWIVLVAVLAAIGTEPSAGAPPTDHVGAGARPTGVEERGFILNGANPCVDATPIYGLGTYSFNLSSATTDGLAHAACANANSSQIWRDLWWRWQSPVSGVVAIETCGTANVDTRIAVYAPSSPCAPADEYLLGCNDDACATQSRVTFVAQAGQTYLVRLGRFGVTEPAASGSGSMQISSQEEPQICGEMALCQEPVAAQFGYASTSVYRGADDVLAPATGAIEGLCWWGSYNPFPAGPDNFRVTYWTDNNGLPGAPIASFDQDLGLGVLRVPTVQTTGAGAPLFQYSAHHVPVPVVQNQRVWVEVRNRIGGPDDLWFWQSSTSGNGALHDLSHLSNWGDANTVSNLAMCVDLVSGCRNDTNGDGLVNFADLNNVISQFNFACP